MALTHGSVLTNDGLVLHACPDCLQPCASNEFAAYGRHEDCWVGDSSADPFSGLPMALRIKLVYEAAFGTGRRIIHNAPPGV